jgi:hypothetical protein
MKKRESYPRIYKENKARQKTPERFKLTGQAFNVKLYYRFGCESTVGRWLMERRNI